MKNPGRANTKAKKQDTNAACTVASIPATGLPADLEQFEGKTPLQIIKMIVPNVKDEPFAAVCSGFGLDLGIAIPEWARRASGQFWKYFVGTDFDPMYDPEDLGILVGLIDGVTKAQLLDQDNKFKPWIENLLPVFLDTTNNEVKNSPAGEAAKYYSGRAKSYKIVDRVTNPDYLKMIKRAPIYLAVAAFWQRFQSFATQAEAERWLRSEAIIGNTIDSREVRAAFAVVGLKYRGPGRPKKTENGLRKSRQSGFCKKAKS